MSQIYLFHTTVTADVVGLYPSIPHEAGLRALKFLFKNNYFEFNGQIKHQISGTAIDTKSASTFACIFIDGIETKFLQTQQFQPLV